jgi:cob(I)alamin adenosyltransferase
VWRLSAGETINPPVMMYLNRLSDLLFVMARVANDDGRSDVTWIPGGDASDSASR